MFLGMSGAGGVGKNVDAVAAKIAQIENSLKSIDKLMGQIGKSSGGLASALPGSGTGPGTGSGLGSGAPLFNPKTNVTTAPSFSQAFSGRFPKVSAGLGMVTGVGSGVWNALPGYQDVISQRNGLFQANLGNLNNIDYTKMNQNLSSAFGGYATSISSQQNSAAIAASFGYGGFGKGSIGAGLAGQSSALSLLNGRSQEQNMMAGISLGSAQSTSRLMQLGISSVDRNGNPNSLDSITQQIWNKTAKGPMTAANVNRALRPDSNLRNMLTYYVGADNVDTALDTLRMKAGVGGNANAKNVAGLAANAKNGFYNANASQMQATGTRSDTVAAYGDKVIEGFNAALAAAQQLDKTLTAMKDVLGPLAQAKGFTQGFGSTASGAATLGAASLVGSAGGNLLSNLLGGRGLGSKAMDALKAARGGPGGMMGALRSGAGRLLGAMGGPGALLKGTGFGLAAAGAGWAQGKLSEWGDQHGAGGNTALGKAGRVAASAGVGALTGAAVGSVVPVIGTAIGAVAGGVIGAGVGLWSNVFGGNDNNTAMGDGAGGGSGSTGAKVSGNSIAGYAQQFVGVPYRDTGSKASPKNGWGCSQFTAWVFKQKGIILPAFAPSQFKMGTAVSKSDLRAGDLVFFYYKNSPYAHFPNHVGIYVGNGQMVHAANPHSGTIVSGVDWGHFVGARRITGGGNGASPNTTSVGKAGATGGAVLANGATGVTGTPSNGMASANAVQAVGADISANAYGGVSASSYSISGMVGSTIQGLMGGGGGVATGVASGYSGGGRGSSAGVPSSGGAAPAGSPVSGSSANGQYTVQSWAAAFLNRLGISQTGSNVKAVETWERFEGGNWKNAASYNPLNTTQQMGKDKSINSAGVKAYNSWSEGMDASVKTITNGRYGSILSALKSGAESDIYHAINGSPWGTHVPGYSAGAWRIGQDQLAKIHQGEMILPASVAEAVRTGMRQGYAGQKGGGSGKSVVIQVILQGASEGDARQLAKRVKEILDEDAQINMIGGF